jgi:uncharacterized protein (DUF433 family)
VGETIFDGNPMFTEPQSIAYNAGMTTQSLIMVDPEVLGGTPVFKGTRVPVATLYDYLEDDYSLEEFLEYFPTVSREVATRVLEQSKEALLEPA